MLIKDNIISISMSIKLFALNFLKIELLFSLRDCEEQILRH